MKKILKLTVVLVALLSAVNVSAIGNDFSIDVRKAEGKTLSFALHESNKVILSIFDADHKVIYKEMVNSKGSFYRKYDLNSLPSGTYYLVAESDLRSATYEIAVSSNKAVLSTMPVSEVAKPVLYKENGVVKLNVDNKAKTPVAVRIYDETNELVYSESFLNMDKVEKVFDISERSYENYTFIVAYDTDKFIEKTLSAK